MSPDVSHLLHDFSNHHQLHANLHPLQSWINFPTLERVDHLHLDIRTLTRRADLARWQNRPRLDKNCHHLSQRHCHRHPLCGHVHQQRVLAGPHLRSKSLLRTFLPLLLRSNSRLSLISLSLWTLGNHHQQPDHWHRQIPDGSDVVRVWVHDAGPRNESGLLRSHRSPDRNSEPSERKGN